MEFYWLAMYDYIFFLQIHQHLFLTGEKKKIHFTVRILVSEVMFIVCGILIMGCIRRNYFTPNSIILYLIIYAVSCVALVFCYKLSFIDVIFGSTCGYAAQHIGAALASVMRFLFGITSEHMVLFFGTDILCQILVLLILYLIFIYNSRYMIVRREKDGRMVFFAVVILFVTIVLSTQTDNGGSDLDSYTLYLENVICRFYGIICSIFAIAIEFTISRMNEVEKQKKLMGEMIHSLGEQQKVSRESVNIINRKCHDIKYQMKALSYAKGDAEREKSISELRKAISIYDSVYHTGNETLNLILREKALLCEEYEIQFSCLADGDILSFISSEDLYVLLGNALDNAIESVKKEEKDKRVISLKIAGHKNMVYVRLANYCKRFVEFEDGLPVTTKPDRNYHGFGVKSIQYITEKYSGNLLMHQDKEQFIVDILIPQKV